ncbi:hypothetical protein Tco_0887177 [Tanacetum coccineum]
MCTLPRSYVHSSKIICASFAFSSNSLEHEVPLQAEEKKAEIRKIPKQLILSEVRQMVQEMQAVNSLRKLSVPLLIYLYNILTLLSNAAS